MIIVTGGSSGLGKFIAQSLENDNHKVIRISRRSSNFENHLNCDIRNYEDLRKTYKKIKDLGEPVFALINCAGIASMNLALTTPKNVIENIINTNLIGTIYTNQVFAPLIIRSGKGRIINFSTIAVSIALEGESVYSASKAGVECFSKVFAKELANFRITVNCIAPGPIRTNLIRGINEVQIKNILKNQIIKKEFNHQDVFDIVKLILSPDSSSLTGMVFPVGGNNGFR